MSKIYVVTSGDWSGDNIHAVFSTREKAEKCYGTTFSQYSVEEWEIDGEPDHVFGLRIYMDYATGDWDEHSVTVEDITHRLRDSDSMIFLQYYTGVKGRLTVCFHFDHTDQALAIKIAQEKCADLRLCGITAPGYYDFDTLKWKMA